MPPSSNPSVTLRPVADGDEPFLHEVYASTRREEVAPLPWSAEQKEAFLRMQSEAQHKYYLEQFSEAEMLVVLVDGEPAGRLYVDRREEEIRLVDIALLPAYRGGGIGGSLLRGLLREAREAGKPVRIHVEKQNPALRLYERLGFQRIGDRGVYWLMEWSSG